MVDEALWKIVAFVLAIVLMVIFPILHLNEKQDQLVYYRVMDDTENFLKRIKSTGYIEKNQWLEFQNKINSYGLIFDIDLTHEIVEYVPIYEEPTDRTKFKNEFKSVYSTVTNDEITSVLFPKEPTEFNVNRVYKLKYGDFIAVHVMSKYKTRADAIKYAILKIEAPKFNIRFSAMVSN